MQTAWLQIEAFEFATLYTCHPFLESCLEMFESDPDGLFLVLYSVTKFYSQFLNILGDYFLSLLLWGDEFLGKRKQVP